MAAYSSQCITVLIKQYMVSRLWLPVSLQTVFTKIYSYLFGKGLPECLALPLCAARPMERSNEDILPSGEGIALMHRGWLTLVNIVRMLSWDSRLPCLGLALILAGMWLVTVVVEARLRLFLDLIGCGWDGTAVAVVTTDLEDNRAGDGFVQAVNNWGFADTDFSIEAEVVNTLAPLEVVVMFCEVVRVAVLLVEVVALLGSLG